MYSAIYKNHLFPFYETFIRRRNTIKYLNALEKNQWMSPEEIVQFQWNELKKILDHAYRNYRYYRDLFDKLKLSPDDIKNYKDFSKLPIISKEDIRSNKSRMIADNYRGRIFTKATGGSTGVPLQLDYDSNSYQWRIAVAMRGYGWAGCDDGKRIAYIWGAPIGKNSFLTTAKKELHNFVLRRRMYNCFKFTEEVMNAYLRDLNKFNPEAIVGYATPLYNFARFIKENKKVAPRVKSVITAAERVYDYQRSLVEEVFSAKVFATYGSREFMLIAAECEEHNGMHINTDNLYVEILKNDGTSAQHGELGEIIITDLHNYGMPFIRYKIGDLGIATDRICACGRGLPLIDKIEGRVLDTIRTPDGRIVPGEFFPHLMKEFKWVKQFQVTQEDINNLNIRIVKAGDINERGFNMMKNEIYKVLGETIKVDFQFVDNIPLTQSGKFRVTVSKISRPS